MLSKKVFWFNLSIVSVLLLLNLGCSTAQRKLSDAEAKALQPSGQLVDGLRVIKIEAKKFEFVPDIIVVKSGEKVQLEVTSTDVEHGFAISELKINRQLKPNTPETIVFTADKTGEYPIHCSVFCGMGHLDMKATLVVLPAGN